MSDLPPEGVIARVGAWIAEQGVPRPGEAIVVGCSGGGDSTALLIALASLGNYPLHALYIDHGLRDGTDDEAARVATFAAALGADFERIAVTVARRGNLLAAAREARYQALAECAERRGARFVAVGHTATDQAETVVFRAARGDVAHALAGIPKLRPLAPGIDLLRPLLDVRRDEAAALVAARGWEPIHDPTNDRGDLTRTRIRRALARIGGAEEGLCGLARATAEWVRTLDARAAALGPLDRLEARAVAAAGSDVALRLLRRAGLADAGRSHARALAALAAGTAGTRTLDLGAGLVAERRYEQLRIGPPAPADPGDLSVPVHGPGRYQLLPDGEVTIGCDGDRIDLGRFPWPWDLRNARPGDRLRTRAGRRKLQDVLTDLKVPAPERRRVPLLAWRGEVLWVGGVGTAWQVAPLPSANTPFAAVLTPPRRVQ
ncbi:MAG: tRNA lysidine(34) synthetase TilS [Myxococcales bacterium]|nr:tRNA lysidine(34) synthetase TilS [Myxococcales bacterium]